MNNEFTESNLMHVLPAPLDADKGMHDLGETAAKALTSLLWKQVHLPSIYARIDELPEDLLDVLAKDFKVDWYNYNLNVDAKRALIKDSFFIHKHLGTPDAVARAVADVFGGGRVEEWWEYEGEPYHFRVWTESTTAITKNRAAFLRLLDIVKNVRSVLDNVYYYGESAPATGYAATKMYAVIGRAASPLAMRQTSDRGEATARGFAATRVWAAAMRWVLPVLAAPDVQRAALRDDQGGMVLDSTGFPIIEDGGIYT